MPSQLVYFVVCKLCQSEVEISKTECFVARKFKAAFFYVKKKFNFFLKVKGYLFFPIFYDLMSRALFTFYLSRILTHCSKPSSSQTEETCLQCSP